MSHDLFTKLLMIFANYQGNKKRYSQGNLKKKIKFQVKFTFFYNRRQEDL